MDRPTETSAGADTPRTAAVFGAGIAGLSAAHEFARLRYAVSVYEATGEAGVFYRSARCPGCGNTPSEYSWHGMGPWYHNTFDLLRQITFDETGSVYDKGLSRPIDFCLAPDAGRRSTPASSTCRRCFGWGGGRECGGRGSC
jgi:hypothetical protein